MAASSFAPPQDLEVGNSPEGVVVADLNGDQVPDLVTADRLDDQVSVLLGNGDGTFQAPVAFDTGNGSVAVATGDLDGDGHIDLAVANHVDDTVSVLFGDGAAAFAPPADYDVDSDPRWVVAGDMNLDGHLDLVTVNKVGDSVSVLLNQGDGRVTAASFWPAPTPPRTGRSMAISRTWTAMEGSIWWRSTASRTRSRSSSATDRVGSPPGPTTTAATTPVRCWPGIWMVTD
jgi:hypothetical protein